MTGNPGCPLCHGAPPSTDGRTECGWCSEDYVPPVVPTSRPMPMPEPFVLDEPGCPLCSPWDGCGWCGDYVPPVVREGE